MLVADANGLPIALLTESASPAEVRLVEATLGERFVEKLPQRLIGDKAYDSDPLDEILRAHGIALISPHKVNRVRAKTQDGRVLRRYRKRWKIERCFAWLQNFRRLVNRWEYHAHNFHAFVLLGCAVILLRNYF